MMDLLSSLLVVGSLWTTVSADEAAEPYQMSWSSKSLGPDGPWRGVEVGIGSKEQKIVLYPGGAWSSNILTTYTCQNTTVSSICYGDTAGLFNSDQSSTFDNTSIYLSSSGDITYGLNGVPQFGQAKNSFDDMTVGGHTVPNVSMKTVTSIYQTYPGGQSYSVEVGILSLGANNLNQTFTENSGPAINTTFVPSYLYTSGSIPSYSYGMHIGSVSFDIPGSLFLGGYDKSRALEPVSAQSYNGASFPIELLDIDLGVADGGSPWDFDNKTGLLTQGNSTIGQAMSVLVSPSDPYIYLPQSTCDAITQHLPVEFHAGLGLYYWNTSDPKYNKIITSPSYLGFVFRLNSVNTANFSVNVPFALLNLTLDAPLADTPTQYFPCFPTNGTYGLGRAFLQAAFVGVNWGKGTGNWFLAQAPGPNYQTTPSTATINPTASAISGSGSSWEDSWTGHWTPLTTNNDGSAATSTETDTANHGNNSDDNSSGGLSSGAKAGIGVGVGVGGLALISGLAFFLLRRRNRSETKPEGQPLQGGQYPPNVAMAQPYSDKDPKPTYPYYGGPPPPPPAPVELENQEQRPVHELQ